VTGIPVLKYNFVQKCVVCGLHMRLVYVIFINVLLFDSVTASGHVVQFVVHANEKTDVERLFPGSYVDFTWNNVFVVSIWTSEPAALMKSVSETLDLNSNIVQTLVVPYALESSTQKWLQYNLVWVLMLVLVFVAGCACGSTLVIQCFDAQKAIFRHRNAGMSWI
jgi:hypothetical protein